MTRWLLPAAALAGLLLVAWLARGANPAEAPRESTPRFRAHEGTRLEYAIETTTRGWSALGEIAAAGTDTVRRPGRAAQVPIHARIAGRLSLTFLETPVETSGWRVAAKLRDGVYEVGVGGESGRHDASAPFRFTLDAAGTVRDLEFRPSEPLHVQRALESVVRGLQVSLPAPGVGTWRAAEPALGGSWEVTYQLDAAPSDAAPWTAQKRWTRFVPAAAGPEEVHLTDHAARQSHGVVTFRPGDAWLDSARWELTVEDTQDGVVLAYARTVFEAHRVEPSEDVSIPSSVGPARPPVARAAAGRGAAQPLATAPVPPVSEFVAAFEADVKRDYAAARDALLRLLRTHPGAATALARHLDEAGDTLGPDLELTLWRMLATSGTDEAQGVLADALLGNGYREDACERALGTVRSVPRPSADLVEGLWTLHLRTGGSQDRRTQDRHVMALLAIGSLGRARHGDPELADGISDRLLQGLASADSPEERQEFLDALGNQGSARALPALLDQTHDTDPRVRSAAYQAMRNMTESKAATALIDGYRREPDVDVRAAILTTLGRMPSQDSVLRWAAAEVEHVESPSLQIGLVGLLGAGIQHDEAAEPALRALLARHPQRDVRKAIYGYLPPGGGSKERAP